jgi:hypothetical protein
MASQSLLNEQVQQGHQTLTVLDGIDGLDVRAAYWIFDEAAQEWRFTIAEPTVDQTGTRLLYEKISQALEGQSETLRLHDIYAVSPNDQLISLVRLAISTPPTAIAGISFTGNVVMGTRVPDMYIYRMYVPPIRAAGP